MLKKYLSNGKQPSSADEAYYMAYRSFERWSSLCRETERLTKKPIVFIPEEDHQQMSTQLD